MTAVESCTFPQNANEAYVIAISGCFSKPQADRFVKGCLGVSVCLSPGMSELPLRGLYDTRSSAPFGPEVSGSRHSENRAKADIISAVTLNFLPSLSLSNTAAELWKSLLTGDL